MAEPAHNWVYQQSVEDVRTKECDPSANHTERADTDPRKTDIDDGPSQFTPEENTLFAFGHDDVAHWPRNHAQRHAKTYPSQNLNGPTEFGTVEQRKNYGRKGEGSYYPWAS